MQVQLTKVARFTTDKNNEPLKTKDGRNYTRIRIQTNEHIDQWLSGFENPETENWREGDTVEIDVKQVGVYLNFSTPKKADVLEARVTELEKRVTALEK